MNFKDYDYIIPIGSNCRISLALRECDLRKYSFPLDWCLSSMRCVNMLFENRFENFINEDSCSIESINLVNKSTHKYILNNIYNLNIAHENVLSKPVIDKHNRRVERLLEILDNENNSVLFIRNMLDGDVMCEAHNQYLKEELDNFSYKENDTSYLVEFNKIVNEKYKCKSEFIFFSHTQKYDIEGIDNFKSNVKHNGLAWDFNGCVDIIKTINEK